MYHCYWLQGIALKTIYENIRLDMLNTNINKKILGATVKMILYDLY